MDETMCGDRLWTLVPFAVWICNIRQRSDRLGHSWFLRPRFLFYLYSLQDRHWLSCYSKLISSRHWLKQCKNVAGSPGSGDTTCTYMNAAGLINSTVIFQDPEVGGADIVVQVMENGICKVRNTRGYVRRGSNHIEREDPQETDTDSDKMNVPPPRRTLHWIDRVSQFVFPTIYVIFLFAYTLRYTTLRNQQWLLTKLNVY